MLFFPLWWAVLDSNQRPPQCQCDALPTALTARIMYGRVIPLKKRYLIVSFGRVLTARIVIISQQNLYLNFCFNNFLFLFLGVDFSNLIIYNVSMSRNKNKEISEISTFLTNTKSKKEIESFFMEILTNTELDTLSKRWRILSMLSDGCTQREIAKELKVSLCKVTRGSKILKNKNSVSAKYFKKGE